jgi:hypothetical protein
LGLGNSSFSELPRNLSNAKGSFHFSSGNSFKSYFIPDCPTNQKFCAMEAIRNFTHVECKPGISGDRCEIHSCFGKSFNDSSVCSSKGECLCLNICNCSSGYFGSECQHFKCNSMNNTDPNGCSDNGRCYAPNQCECFSGYMGSNCETTIQCFGVNRTESNACSGRGECIGTNICNCYTPYTGSNCERTYLCLEDPYNTTKVCSKHGRCINENVCRCDSPYIGNTCEIFGCGPCNFGSCQNNLCICPINRRFDGENCVCTFFYIGAKCEDLSISGIFITIICVTVGVAIIIMVISIIIPSIFFLYWVFVVVVEKIHKK